MEGAMDGVTTILNADGMDGIASILMMLIQTVMLNFLIVLGTEYAAVFTTTHPFVDTTRVIATIARVCSNPLEWGMDIVILFLTIPWNVVMMVVIVIFAVFRI